MIRFLLLLITVLYLLGCKKSIGTPVTPSAKSSTVTSITNEIPNEPVPSPAPTVVTYAASTPLSVINPVPATKIVIPRCEDPETNHLVAETQPTLKYAPPKSQQMVKRPRNVSALNASTWDGRVFVGQVDYPPEREGECTRRGWYVQVFRPENTTIGSDGHPIFFSAERDSFSPITSETRFNFLEKMIPTGETIGSYTVCKSITHPLTGLMEQNALALVKDPQTKNSFRSEENGDPNQSGLYETYPLLIYTQLYSASDTLPATTLGMIRAKIVIQSPRTASATLKKAFFTDRFQPLRFFWNGSYYPLRGIEPTATFDGKLLIYQGRVENNGSILTLVYSYNPNPSNPDGWSKPRSVSHMFNDGNLRGTYPLAKFPLKKPDGTFFLDDEVYPGAYPWVDLDGSLLVHTATMAGVEQPAELRHRSNLTLRGGLSAVGKPTNWTLRHLDGAMNLDRWSRMPDESGPNKETIRVLFSSFGLYPSPWFSFGDAPNFDLPVHRNGSTLTLLSALRADYSETDLSDATDGNYVVSLHMNESLKGPVRLNSYTDPNCTFSNKSFCATLSDYEMQPDTENTPDTSGKFNNASLQGGAKFPVEYGLQRKGYDFRKPPFNLPTNEPPYRLNLKDANGEYIRPPYSGLEYQTDIDGNPGINGRAIYFPETGFLHIPYRPSLDTASTTIALWIKPLLASTRPQNLISREGVFRLTLGTEGLKLYLRINERTELLADAETIPQTNQWVHLAFTYSSKTGMAQIYRNAILTKAGVFVPGALSPSSAPLIIGPQGSGDAGAAIFLIDEVSVSNVERTRDQIEKMAYRYRPLQTEPESPSAVQIELGKRLFFDKRLSTTKTISCASCHKPGFAFADNVRLNQGTSGISLPRNTPTLLFRKKADVQFLDGRAATLEEQAIGPLTNPHEMGNKLCQIVYWLNESPNYVDLFQRAYGKRPDAQTLLTALRDYERTIISKDSPYDRYVNDHVPLSANAERGRKIFSGKGRCLGCHRGSNLTDELFHNTGVTNDSYDFGRERITGISGDKGKFKTPTLREIAKTAPYFHDGSAPNLRAVIEIYNSGGNALTANSELVPLGLSEEEKNDLEEFLRSLSGKTMDARQETTLLEPSVLNAPEPLYPNMFVSPVNNFEKEWRDFYGVALRGSYSFAKLLFEVLLGRQPDASELDQQILQLENQTTTRQGLFEKILQSTEFQSRRVR